MEPLRDLLATDHRRALEFFVLGLTDVCEPTVDRQELLYNASVLAHFAQVSTHAQSELPTPASLTEVFDHFVLATGLPQGSVMLETAGAQCLLLTGFLRAPDARATQRPLVCGPGCRVLRAGLRPRVLTSEGPSSGGDFEGVQRLAASIRKTERGVARPGLLAQLVHPAKAHPELVPH